MIKQLILTSFSSYSPFWLPFFMDALHIFTPFKAVFCQVSRAFFITSSAPEDRQLSILVKTLFILSDCLFYGCSAHFYTFYKAVFGQQQVSRSFFNTSSAPKDRQLRIFAETLFIFSKSSYLFCNVRWTVVGVLISTEEGGYILICNIVACAFPQILDNSLISVLPWDGSRFLESHYSDSPVKCREKNESFFFSW